MASKRVEYSIRSQDARMTAEAWEMISPLRAIKTRAEGEGYYQQALEMYPELELELWEETGIYENNGRLSEFNNRVLKRHVPE